MTNNKPHWDLCYKIIGIAQQLATSYLKQNPPLEIDSALLHDKFRDDINNELNLQGIHSVTEEHFPKPLREGLVKGQKVRHFADIMVQDSVLVEIKCGN
ncbi:hypothetical protein ACFL57_05650, partial [Candidatus Margulisiibacteriota bacterium]